MKMEHVVEAPHAGVVSEVCVRVGEQVPRAPLLISLAVERVAQGMPRHVRIVEVGPRDGLQNEAAQIPTDVKVHFVDLLREAGFHVDRGDLVRPPESRAADG